MIEKSDGNPIMIHKSLIQNGSSLPLSTHVRACSWWHPQSPIVYMTEGTVSKEPQRRELSILPTVPSSPVTVPKGHR